MTHPTDTTSVLKSSSRRRLATGLNTIAALVLAAVLVAMLNYLSSRHYHRTDWSRSKYYSLSDKTKGLLDGLTNRIDVVIFFQPGQAIFDDVVNLLKEYSYASPRIHVEQVDPDRDLGRTEELSRKYQVTQPNVVVFDNAGRSKYVSAGDIMDVDYSSVMQGGRPEPSAFKGEQAFSSAIQSITQERKPLVYFLQGHGEREIEDRDPFTGFSGLAQQVRRDNVDVKTLILGESHTVPDDADALIIAGPKKKISQPEIDVLRAYLEKSGRLLLMLDAGTDAGLQSLLEEWGVRITDDVVIDPTRTLSGLDLFVSDYGLHPVTRQLNDISTVFYLPRSVEPAEGPAGDADRADKPKVTSLAKSSEKGWAEVDMEQKPVSFDPGRDRKGPISIAVAVEKGPSASLHVDIRPTRAIVFGDSDFVGNSSLSGGNIDFFLSAMNWLLEREQLMAIAPKAPDETRLVMNGSQLVMLFWVVVVGLPGAVATLGALVWLRRRT